MHAPPSLDCAPRSSLPALFLLAEANVPHFGESDACCCDVQDGQERELPPSSICFPLTRVSAADRSQFISRGYSHTPQLLASEALAYAAAYYIERRHRPSGGFYRASLQLRQNPTFPTKSLVVHAPRIEHKRATPATHFASHKLRGECLRHACLYFIGTRRGVKSHAVLMLTV